MKKVLLLLLCLGMSLSVLVSCIDFGTGPDTDTDTDNDKEDKTFLVEDEDYIDLTSKYDGESIDFDESLWYMNMLDDVSLPDPFVFVEGDTYYIIGTNERNVNTVDCYVTKDFVNYKLHKDIYDPSVHGGWESDKAAEIYAPEMYCFDGVYYLYYSANDESGVRRCSVVSADNPLGPYTPIVNERVDGQTNPLFINEDHSSRALDATIFTDNDGRRYMYFTVTEDTQHIVGVELISPYEADWSTYTSLVVPGTLDSEGEEVLLEWETYRDSRLKIAEAPFMIKSGGKYYLTYSVNGCWNKYYNVCYAVSDTPLGNFVKPYEEGRLWTNLLLGYPGTNDSDSTLFGQWDGFASGTGHHCFFYAGDELMVGYHAHKNRGWDSNYYTERGFAFDYVYFDENGTPFCNGPTYSVINLPKSISGLSDITANATVTGSNVQNVSGVKDKYIVDCYNLDSEGDEVILGKGESYIEIDLGACYEIAAIMVYNSAYYDNYVLEIEYIDFGNGNIVYYPQFCEDLYVDHDKEFIRPGSCFNLEFITSFEADSVKIGFNLPDGGSINEIVILAK